jgi:tetratricopeptide (TPR) repeat protein
LNLTIVEFCQRQPQPVLLLLEDLQWCNESLEPLKMLLRMVRQLPWLVVCNYRDEERRDLPVELPEAQLIKLNRLNETAIAELSAAMLGKTGEQPEVLALIQRESEGNTFFVVEVVRALAEEAGQLSAIGRHSLPRNLLAGGMQQVLRRRLARVPGWAQATLKVAAVVGRQLDPPVLLATAGDLDWESWLTACANAAVLDMADGHWRFAHDKLRATLLADLADNERSLLHGQVAQALEIVYPNDIAYAETLVDHWEQAGVQSKALPYLVQVIERFIRITANYAGAEALIARGLRYTETSHHAILLRLAGDAKRYQYDYEGALAHYAACLQINPTNLQERAAVFNGLSSACCLQGRYGEAEAYARQALAAAGNGEDTHNLATGLYNLAVIADAQGQYEFAKRHYGESLAIWQRREDRWGQARVLNRLGVMASKEGKREVARAYFDEGLQIYCDIADHSGIVVGLMSLGILAEEMGEFSVARTYYAESLREAQMIGDQQFIALGMHNVGCSYVNEGDYTTAIGYFQQSLPLFVAIGDRNRVALSHANLGFIAYIRGEDILARQYLENSLQIAREIGDREGIALQEADLALVLLRLGEQVAAQAVLVESLQLAQALAMPAPQARALLSAAYVAHAAGEDALAAHWLGALWRSCKH